MKDKKTVLIGSAAVFAAMLIFYLLRLAGEAVNSVSDGTWTFLLIAFMIIGAALVFFCYTLAVFAISAKKYAEAAVFTAVFAVCGAVLSVIDCGFQGFADSLVPVLLMSAAAFLIPFGLSFVMKTRPVLFTVSAILTVFLNILLLNAFGDAGDAALGCVFPNIRVESDLGFDYGLIAYMLFAAVFAADYFILRAVVKKCGSRKEDVL